MARYMDMGEDNYLDVLVQCNARLHACCTELQRNNGELSKLIGKMVEAYSAQHREIEALRNALMLAHDELSRMRS